MYNPDSMNWWRSSNNAVGALREHEALLEAILSAEVLQDTEPNPELTLLRGVQEPGEAEAEGLGTEESVGASRVLKPSQGER